MKILQSKTDRGFAFVEFLDFYNHECEIQKSSLATDDAIWFGISNPQVSVMAKNAKKVGVKTDKETGWVDYPIPQDVHIFSRMHLTRDQVKAILPILQHFVKTGEVAIPKKEK